MIIGIKRRKMGDKPAWCHPFRHEYEIKSLSEQKTTNLSYGKATQYIGTTRKFYNLFNISHIGFI
jgi:hypothetical protein